ncbi:MAG: hypothetical protein WAM07_18575 [Halobacillus sp.]
MMEFFSGEDDYYIFHRGQCEKTHHYGVFFIELSSSSAGTND